MALDVKIIINMIKPVGNVGFGCPLILEENATTGIEYKEVATLDEVVTAGFAVTSNVYKVAQLMFMQEHAPEKIAVCSATVAAETWLADDENVRPNWRRLVVLKGGEAETNVSEIIKTIEAQKTYPKMYFASGHLLYQSNPITLKNPVCVSGKLILFKSIGCIASFTFTFNI